MTVRFLPENAHRMGKRCMNTTFNLKWATGHTAVGVQMGVQVYNDFTQMAVRTYICLHNIPLFILKQMNFYI